MSDPTHTTETTVPGLAFAAMRMIMLHEAREHDMPVLCDTDTRVTLDAYYGTLDFQAEEDGLKVRLLSHQADWLYLLKDGFLEHLTHAVPGIADQIRWSDNQPSGGLPPNFHFVTVEHIQPIGTAFLRVQVLSRNLGQFRDDAIHFRLVLPPKGMDTVEWPYVAKNGGTVWPKGDKALHRPVYTTRWINHQTGQMAFDVFIHDGGRTTDWARAAQPGDQLALIGPGGGGVPDTRKILMFADETGFPAVARILETLAEDTTGHVTLMADRGALCAYPVTAPAGVSVQWIEQEPGEALAQRVLAAHRGAPDHFLWLAAEKSAAQPVRTQIKKDGSDPQSAYIAAYWSRG